jgi:pimeloyl-ACP methyl ester carboxylesterase
LTVPTLVIWGMSDPAVLPGSLHGLEDYVQDLRVVRIDDAGHYPMRTHPGAVNRAIRDFVRRAN